MEIDPEENQNREFSDDDIKDILSEALSFRLKEQKKIPKKPDIHNTIISVLSEFLSCFRLIGYDLNGDPVNMLIYKEKIEKSALDNAFMEEVAKSMINKEY